MKNGINKFAKGIFAIFTIKLLIFGTIFIIQSCSEEDNIPSLEVTNAKNSFLESLQESRTNLSNAKIISSKEFHSSSSFNQKSTDVTLTKVDLIKTNPTDEIDVNDFGDLTYYINKKWVSLKPTKDNNDVSNDGTQDEGDCTNVNGEEICLSVNINESQVKKYLDPAIQAAKDYLYEKGFTDLEIENDIFSEWDGSEEHLVPFVMYLVEFEVEDPSASSLKFRDVFFNSAYAQSTKIKLTADEVWDCAKDAVGIGFVSAVAMHGAKKLGIKILTKAFTKFVSKFAGPVGAAIMVADFGFCLYGAAND